MFGHGAGRAADLQYWERTADVCVTDPRALDNARRTLEDVGSAVTFEPDPYRAVKRAHAIALLTDWEEYRYLDYASIYADMEKPAFLFDGRNLLDPQGLHDVGFNVYSVGRPPRTAV